LQEMRDGQVTRSCHIVLLVALLPTAKIQGCSRFETISTPPIQVPIMLPKPGSRKARNTRRSLFRHQPANVAISSATVSNYLTMGGRSSTCTKAVT
jgi:hypothetical protein